MPALKQPRAPRRPEPVTKPIEENPAPLALPKPEDPSTSAHADPARADPARVESAATAGGSAEPTEQNLLDALLSPEASLDALARRHTLTLRGLIAWAEQRDIVRLRHAMRRLADDRADLIASRARVIAAHRLADLASDDHEAHKETSRKACVDLLRFRCAAPEAPPREDLASPDAADPDAAPQDLASERAFLDALEREARAAADLRPAAPIATPVQSPALDPDRATSEPAD